MTAHQLVTLKAGLKQAFDAAEALIGQRSPSAVRPVYVNDGDRPVHAASCAFIAIDDQDYLITAAHVVDLYPSHALYVGQGELIGLNLTFSTTRAPSGNRDLDRLDFAFAPVGSEWRDAGVVPFEEAELAGPEARFYCAYGFPNSRNKAIDHVGKKIIPTARPFISSPVTDASKLKAEGLDPDHHLTLFRDPKIAFDNGMKVTPFEPRGMSGGVIFGLQGLNRYEVLAGGEPPTIVCDAIVTHKSHKHKLLYGTKVSTIIEAIRHGASKKP